MPIQIHITGESAGEAVKELSDLASHFLSDPVKEEKPKRQIRKQEEPEKQKAPKESEKAEEPEESEESAEEESESSDSDDEYVPTVVELRAKAQEVGKTPEAKKAIKALLDEFGSKSISDVPEGKRAALMAALEAL